MNEINKIFSIILQHICQLIFLTNFEGNNFYLSKGE